MLALTWQEAGGPLVHVPTKRGFGTRSLIASIETQLGGQALFDWQPEGLICRLQVPLEPKASVAELKTKQPNITMSDGPLRQVHA
jgi:two-component sensor histidine kinase